jgi:hypothetical protein
LNVNKFTPSKSLVKNPGPTKVKSGGSKPNMLKPIPTPEERALMLAKARKLNAESRNLAFKDGC